MISVFTCDKVDIGDSNAVALKGLKAFKRNADIGGIKQQEVEAMNDKLSALEDLMESEGVEVEEIVKGVAFTAGVNGLSYVKSHRRSFENNKTGNDVNKANKGRISCFFSGDLTQKHINEISIDKHLHDDSDCQKIISMYINATVVNALGDFAVGGNFGPIIRNALKQVTGSYTFILYDRVLKRIVAGRSPDGAEELFWAVGSDQKSLMFSSNRMALYKHGEAVTEFPKGAVFVSDPGDLVGTLNSKKYKFLKEMMCPAPTRRRASCVLPSAPAIAEEEEADSGDQPTFLNSAGEKMMPLRERRAATSVGESSPFSAFSKSMRKSIESLS